MTDLTKLEQEVAQREAELRTAQEQMREAKRKAEEAKREAERKEQLERISIANNKAYVEKYEPVAKEICAKVKELGETLSYEEPDFSSSPFPKFSDYYRIKFWSVGRYTHSNSGTICIRVEMGSDQPRQYVLRKDGTFNIERIAESYVELIKRSQAEQERRKKENDRYSTNRRLKKEICETMGISEYSSTVSYSRYHDNAVDLSIRIPNVGKEQAIELLTKLQEMGIELR